VTETITVEAVRNARVLVVGDVMLDRYWFGDVERISPEAPVPVVKVTRTEERLGGAANVAWNMAAIGARPVLLSVVGDDAEADSLQRQLDEHGIQAQLYRDANLSTTIKMRVIGRQQQLIRIDFENEPGHEALAAKLADFEGKLAECDVVVMSDYGKGGLKHIEHMIGLAKEQNKTILIDPKGDDYALGGLLVTRSEEGMTLFRETERLHVATVAREVYDVSGAGDTVIAILAVMLASGQSMAQSVEWANKAAGIVVGKLGTAAVLPEELFD